jgi:hypothetical protein
MKKCYSDQKEELQQSFKTTATSMDCKQINKIINRTTPEKFVSIVALVLKVYIIITIYYNMF